MQTAAGTWGPDGFQLIEKVLRAAARMKQNFMACRKIHKKSGHVPDFLYFESKKVSCKGTFLRKFRSEAWFRSRDCSKNFVFRQSQAPSATAEGAVCFAALDFVVFCGLFLRPCPADAPQGGTVGRQRSNMPPACERPEGSRSSAPDLDYGIPSVTIPQYCAYFTTLKSRVTIAT